MTIGERIKELRLEKGLTLKQVAESVNVSEATMQRYESGKIKNISPDMVNKLADVLSTTPGWLLGEHEKDLSKSAQVVAISKTEKILITIYRTLPPEERELVRNMLLTLNYHHSLINRSQFELQLAEEYIDDTLYSANYTEYKNGVLDSIDIRDIDPTEAVNAEIYDSLRDVDKKAAENFADGTRPADVPVNLPEDEKEGEEDET